jgi:hypothetical protein
VYTKFKEAQIKPNTKLVNEHCLVHSTFQLDVENNIEGETYDPAH